MRRWRAPATPTSRWIVFWIHSTNARLADTRGYVQTLVDIVGLFAGMLLVRIEQHGAVAVDAAAEEVGKIFLKIFLWYAERSESEALGGHEADDAEPVMQNAIAPLNPVQSPAVGCANRSRLGGQAQAPSKRLDQIAVTRDERKMPSVRPQVPVRGHEAYRIGKLHAPPHRPDIQSATGYRSGLPGRDTKSAQPPKHRPGCASELRGDLFRGSSSLT
jgi:hypothetical protein